MRGGGTLAQSVTRRRYRLVYYSLVPRPDVHTYKATNQATSYRTMYITEWLDMIYDRGGTIPRVHSLVSVLTEMCHCVYRLRRWLGRQETQTVSLCVHTTEMLRLLSWSRIRENSRYLVSIQYNGRHWCRRGGTGPATRGQLTSSHQDKVGCYII